MSQTFESIQQLVEDGTVKISDHGYDELADDDIFLQEVIDDISEAEIVEDYTRRLP